jgi:hypothetical protein
MKDRNNLLVFVLVLDSLFIILMLLTGVGSPPKTQYACENISGTGQSWWFSGNTTDLPGKCYNWTVKFEASMPAPLSWFISLGNGLVAVSLLPAVILIITVVAYVQDWENEKRGVATPPVKSI